MLSTLWLQFHVLLSSYFTYPTVLAGKIVVAADVEEQRRRGGGHDDSELGIRVGVIHRFRAELRFGIEFLASAALEIGILIVYAVEHSNAVGVSFTAAEEKYIEPSPNEAEEPPAKSKACRIRAERALYPI